MPTNHDLTETLGEPKHKLIADCPDCGRVAIFQNRCGKCGGDSWLPAGYFDRTKLREYVVQSATS